MIETYYVGAYWKARQESAEDCARRAQTFLQAIGRHSPLLARWFKPPRSRKHSSELLSLEVPSLQERFSQGRTRNDEGGIIEDLGFLTVMNSAQWPGTLPGESSTLWVKCGCYAERLPNSCVLNLPSAGEPRDQVLRAPMLANLLRAMVLAWEPERCIATSHAHRELATERAIVGTFVGWLMYFPRQLGTLPPLPSPAQVEPIEDKGSLLILTPERFTASNPEHVALAARVREELSNAGLLKPLS